MGAVAEAKVVITGSDHTGEAFASVARKVEQLGKTTKKVGEAAASIGKVAGEVDKISGSVGRANAAVERMSGALRTMDGGAASIGRVAAAVDKAAGSMPRLTADAANMAKAMQGVTAAEKALTAETERVAKAGSKLSLFKEMQGDFKTARATFDAAKTGLAGYAKQVEENEMRANALRQRRDIALAAEARARAAYEANPLPGRKDAADKARFDAMKAARAQAASIMLVAEKDRRTIEADLHGAERGEATRKLARDYEDAQKATSLASAALEAQRATLKGVKAEFEGLAGPLVSVSGAEKRLVADAEAATRAFEQQGAAAARAGEAAVRSIAREEEARARQAASNERWMRQFRALEARAGGQSGALAPRGGLTAVEALAAARRRPGSAGPSSFAAKEASAIARGQLDLAAFREVQATTAELRRAAREAQAEALRVGRDVKAARDPSPELLADHARAGGAASSATAAFERQAGVLKGLKADIEGVIGPMHSLASAEAQMASRASAADAALKRQETRHKRLHAAHQIADDVLPFEGPEVLHLTGEAYHEGAMLQHERVGLQNAGRTPEQIEEIERRSREVSAAMPTASSEENLKIVAETTPAFGSLEHALEHLSFMQQTMSVLKTAGGEHIHGSAGDVGRDFAKFFEERLTDPKHFEEEAKQMIPAMVASGGTFNPREMYMFAQQAKSALPNYDMHFLSRVAPSLITAMGGERAGTAANAFNSIIMGKVNDKKQAEAWLKAGLLDPTKLIMSKGHAVGWSAGAVKNTDLALRDPLAWAEQVQNPALAATGVNMDERLEVAKALGTMYRNQNGNMFATEMTQSASRARLHKDEGLYDQVGSADDIYKRNLHEDPSVALGAIGTALSSFAGNVTSPVMKDVAGVLARVSEGIAGLGKAVADFDGAHPDLAKAIGGAALGTGLGVGGYLTTKLFTNLGSLFSGGANAGAAAEMTAAGGMQVEAGRLMLAAAGKGAVPGGGPGGSFPGGETGAKSGTSPGYASLAFRGILAAIGLGTAAAGAPDPSTPEGQRAMDATDKRIGAFNKSASDATGGFFPAEGGDTGADLAQRGRDLAKSLWARIFGTGVPAAVSPLPPVRPADLAPLSALPRPAVMPAPLSALPAGALPSASAVSATPVPVHVVSTSATLPAGPLGPGLHRDFTLGNKTGDFSDPGLGAGTGFSPFPGRHAPPVEAVQAHAVPVGAGPVPGLESLVAQLSGLKATIDGPVTAQVSGNAEVAVTVKVEAGSSLISAVAAASQAKASMPLSSGGGSTGGTGVQRTAATPGTGSTWGAGHR